MRFSLLCAAAGLLLAACHADPPATTTPAPAAAPTPVPDAALALAPLRGSWQLDYYPDSLLLRRDIYDNSNWSAPWAANLRVRGDSCEFLGWHENYTVRPWLSGPGRYRAGDSLQGYELWHVAADKLLLRETGPRADSVPTWYPYHRVAQVLTQPALKRRLARQVFAGRYRVLQRDRPADSLITLGADLRVRGLPGVARYDVVTAMDWNFLLPNGFSWQSAPGQNLKQYSFQFVGDTLVLRNFEAHPEDEDVPSGILVTEPAFRLLRVR